LKDGGNVPLIKKYLFLKLSIVFIFIFGVIFYIYLSGIFQTIEQKYKLEIISHNLSKSKLIEHSFYDVKKDLLYMANIYQGLHASPQHYEDEYLADIQLILKPFIKQKKTYSQIRYLNLTGQEMLRIEYKNGKVNVAKKVDLQNKSNRYYVQESTSLAKGEIYLSKFDLNIENDEIEKPYNPVIRLVTPVFDKSDTLAGYVIINWSGNSIINLLQQDSSLINTILLNKESYYLESKIQSDNWGFILDKRISFKNTYPRQWKKIKSAPSGNFLLDSSIYAFLHIDPVQIISPNRKSLSRRNWIILSYLDQNVIYHKFLEYFYSIWWILFFFITVILLFSYQLAKYIRALKEADYRMDIAYEAFKHSPDGTMVLNKKVEIIQVNKAFEILTGYCEDEARFKNPKFLKDPSYKYTKVFFKEMWGSIKENGFWSGEVHNIRKNGEKYIQHISIGVVKRDGKIINYIGVASDVTQGKKMERETLQAKEASEQANLAKNIFLANMSHEIRTPLNAILGFSELLLSTSLNSEQKNYIDKTNNAASSLLHILNDILDIAKIEAHKFMIIKAPFKPRRVIQQSVDILVLQAQKKCLVLSYEIDEEIPEYLIGDSKRIRQIMINLINNAIKFTEKGYVHINLFLLQKDINECIIEFVVSDSGIGIKESNQKKLFEHFTQVDDSLTRELGGTGLGLAICKQLVDVMDGSIEVESEYGKGSTFSFELKLTLPKQLQAKKSRVQEHTISFKNLKILLVEDNKDNSEVTSLILTKMGADIDEAINGNMALEMVRKKKYDFVLMDIQMPKMDGLQATQILRDEGFTNLLIIALSAHASQIEQERSLNAGMNVHLNKPFRIETLQEILMHWLPSKVTKIKNNSVLKECWAKKLPPIAGLVFSDEICEYWLREEDFLEKLEYFIRNTVKEAAHLHKIIDKKNNPMALKLLHKLKGSVKLYGAQNLLKQILELEDILNSKEYKYTPNLLDEFDAAVLEISS